MAESNSNRDSNALAKIRIPSTNSRHIIRLVTSLSFVALVFKNVFFLKENIRIDPDGSNNAFIPKQNHYYNPVEVEQCTPAELSIIKQQLPPDDCIETQGSPWTQRCSMLYATRCPDSVWLEDHYTKLHFNGHQNHSTTTNNAKIKTPPPFVGIFVGCNKGLDAVNAMRMGSGNPKFDKSVWRDAMTQHGDKSLNRDVCNQASVPQFSLPEEEEESNHISTKTEAVHSDSAGAMMLSQLHCIEPVQSTVHALQQAAYETRYEKMGFVVTHAAVAKEDGMVLFDRGDKGKLGVENKGIGTSDCGSNMSQRKNKCVNVTVYSLDSYVERFVSNSMPIDYLSVDAEGHDWEVLMGGTRNATLARVRYLEFEYNWMGPWKTQSFSEAIEYLDAEFQFTCYWAGFDNTIWRITKCWLDHYDIHFWSNVACVNRNYEEVRGVAESMEKLFQETLLRQDAVRDYEHRFQRKNDVTV